MPSPNSKNEANPKKIGISFFFGAGAENGNHNFGIINGEEYNAATVLAPDKSILNALKKRFPELSDSLLDNANFNAELDSCFHSIALINAYGEYGSDAFAKVFNYYWLCYFAIAEGINNYFGISDYTPAKILSSLPEYSRKISSLDAKTAGQSKPESYYSLINDWLSEHKEKYECIGIGTSNYFRFCEIIDCKNKPCYLNGRFGLFEFPATFEIKEIKGKASPKGLFFPFMFGQSYTKPIVDQTQIRHFNRFCSHLRRSRFFVIVGYGLNSTDNHINAVLAKHLRQTKNHTILVVADQKEEERTRKILANVKRKTTIRFVYWKDGDLTKTPKQVLKEVFDLVERFH